MQSTATSSFTSSKLKYIIIAFLFIILGLTVYKMIQFEDSIRESRIVRINVGGEKKKLIPEISATELQKRSKESSFRFKTGNKYFSILQTKIRNGENIQEWNPQFLKGVNMGVALPGNYPSEFAATYDLYLEWLKKIAGMNANTIRVYTILPVEFYEAFAQYNIDNANKPLYLLQGVWADEADSNNYFDTEYFENFQKEIKNVIDVIHGNAVIKEKPGHAAGTYARDISSYVVGILLGREWEPVTVTTTNLKNSNVRNFIGNFISLPDGTPMECWLAQMMDFTVHYETQIYREQRPVSFVNWLPTDPMYHNSEFIESKKVREYDNDIESIDFSKFYITNLFKAGIYSAYHAYPYYPDFIYRDEKYAGYKTGDKSYNNYYAYLEDLKNHCPDMPLIIAEYGLPSSRGNSHDTPFGFSQGGHSEKDQADKNKILTENIYNSGCGGAVYFEWIDEWFKFNWLVLDFEVPASRRKLWHNMENPEQNFGIMAIEQRTKTMDGSDNDWTDEEKISNGNELNVSSSSDAEYYYMKFRLPGFDFSKNNFYAAIDTYDKIKGDHRLPFLKKEIDRGAEFLLCFINKDSASILVDEEYSVYSDIYNDYVPVYSSKENSNGRFVRQIMLSNRERHSLIGDSTGRMVYDRSNLTYGNSSYDEYSNSNWMWNEEEKMLEIRIPWHLLNVSDPSSANVLDDKEGTGDVESSETNGFYFYSYITDKNDENVRDLNDGNPLFYKLQKWDQPQYTSRLKNTYYMFKDLYLLLEVKQDETGDEEVNQNFKITQWSENKKGAISVSFDDALMTQYTEGVPVMEKYDIKATFAIVSDWTKDNPSSSAEKGNFSIEKFGWKQARELFLKGNEIASHNLYHVKMDTIPVNEALRQMTESRETIERNINSKIYTFVFPYSSTRNDLLRLVNNNAGYLFARTGEESINQSGNINMNRLTTHAIYSEFVPSLDEINNFILDSEGKWLILNYHNIFPYQSKEMNLLRYHNVNTTYSVTPEMFDRQMRLVRNSGYWIAPISTIGKYVTERDNSKLVITDRGETIFLIAESNLPQNIYDVPLTVQLITNWKFVKITNSAADGIYNPRNSAIYVNVFPNKEITIEKLSDQF